MTVWQAILLGILQGATEFLPISSSGHLVIIPYILNWPDPGLFLNAMLHVGTLAAILVYYWRELWILARAALDSLRRRSLAEPESRLAWAVVVGTIPAAVIGFLLDDYFERLFNMPRAAAAFLLGTAALLLLAEYGGRRMRPITSVSWIDAIIVGLAQTVAIAPGLSRSGMTISSGMMMGFRREEAAHFSFLLAVPLTLGTGVYQLVKLQLYGGNSTPVGAVVLGTLAAGLAGFIAIAGLLAFVKRHGLLPFAVYCAALGLLVLSGVLR